MIIDTSVLVAMIRHEPEADEFERLLRGSRDARISAANYLELALVIDAARNPISSAALDEVLKAYRIRIEPFTPSQARLARSAHERFGRGSGHPARLNMGDCFAYALARDLGEPLLFKGNDFTLTDIEIVIEPIRHKRLSEIVASYGIGAP